MKRFIYSSTAFSLLLLVSYLYFGFILKKNSALTTVSTFGKQPALTVDEANTIKLVFGQADEIFYTTSRDGGQSFTPSQKIGKQRQLALGMTRGPQIITTKDYTVVAAAAHTGQILVYRLKNNSTQWSEPVNILHQDTTAKEGFVALARGKENTVYAVRLDMRLGKKNNILTASSPDSGKTWSEGKLVYVSPEGGVCPCCRPSIAADAKGKVYIMFRNELKGSRDMYLATSTNGGQSFSPARKLGLGTWVLKACPMDGGALWVGANGKVGTTWRRENTIFYSEPGSMEQPMGEGRASSLVKTTKGNYLIWQQGNKVVALTPGSLAPVTIGSGIYPRLATLANEQVISVWESEGKILAKRLP